jgi:hypothetical protein
MQVRRRSATQRRPGSSTASRTSAAAQENSWSLYCRPVFSSTTSAWRSADAFAAYPARISETGSTRRWRGLFWSMQSDAAATHLLGFLAETSRPAAGSHFAVRGSDPSSRILSNGLSEIARGLDDAAKAKTEMERMPRKAKAEEGSRRQRDVLTTHKAQDGAVVLLLIVSE